MVKKATTKKAAATKSLRDQIQDALANMPAEQRTKAVAKIRASGVAKAFADRKTQDPELPVAVGLPDGRAVYLGHVQEIEGGVEVWLGEKNGEPAYRIFNPPTLARDPLGDIEVRGQMYREDPLAAVAEAIAGHQQTEKKVRR